MIQTNTHHLLRLGTCALLSTLLSGCAPKPFNHEITIPRISEPFIKIDGVANEADWEDAIHIHQFINPWNPQYQTATDLRLCWDGHELYFCFTVKEATLQLLSKLQNKHQVAEEDRVELFFSPTLPVQTYYALELDAIGRVLDYKVHFPKQFDESWSTGNRLQADGRPTKDGYCVEGRISASLLKEMTGGQKVFYAGAYRGDLAKDAEGNTLYEWQCLKDPKTPQPDFHVSETFCKVTLE